MRQIPTITKNLLIINVLCFLATYVFEGRGVDLNSIFGLHYFQASDFRLYQVITYMFMHGGWTHLFFNMFALWMFGGTIERTFGEKRFLIYYLVCGLGAALCQELSQFVSLTLVDNVWNYTHVNTPDGVMPVETFLNNLTTVGASGSIYGILLAFGMSYPDERMFVFPIPFPIKAKYFVMGYVAIELFLALSQRGDGVAHVAHLGGMLFGFVLIKMWRRTSSSFNGWDGYEVKRSTSATILGKIRSWLHLDRNDGSNDDLKYGQKNTSSSHSKDWEYNAEKRKNEAEIDKILDKIRRSGYDSLTAEEKKKLFDQKK